MRRKNWLLSLFLLFGLLFMAGCGSQAYVEHVWEYRSELIYDNPNLDPLTVTSEIHALGATLDMEPEEIEADLSANLRGEDDDDQNQN